MKSRSARIVGVSNNVPSDPPLSTGSGEFFLWEFPFAYWLESKGYDITYIGNRDTHVNPKGLLRVGMSVALLEADRICSGASTFCCSE